MSLNLAFYLPEKRISTFQSLLDVAVEPKKNPRNPSWGGKSSFKLFVNISSNRNRILSRLMRHDDAHNK